MDSSELRDLAAAYRVDTEYVDWRHERVEVSDETLRAVLAVFGVDASTPDACRAALERKQDADWTRLLPPYVIVRAGEAAVVHVRVRCGEPVQFSIESEDGRQLPAPRDLGESGRTRTVERVEYQELTFEVPGELPTGYHTLVASSADGVQRAQLIVTPRQLRLPERLGSEPRWGLAAQLYSVRSAQSWGVGDLADLAALAQWAGYEHDGAFVLVNPLHAAEPVPPMQPSPYLPTTRRFGNPIYLRVEDIPEFGYLGADSLQQITAAGRGIRDELNAAGRIDRDRAWQAKFSALQVIYEAGLRPARQLAFDAFRRREGRALDDFATWCALCEEHGADWREWPAEFRNPSSDAVRRFAWDNESRVGFYRWLQWLVDEQLAAAQRAAREAGMPLGVLHDLAVGVSPTGADAWALQGELAQRVTVGAPPDPFSDTGQDWGQPPWRPDRLAELAYAPLRDMIRALLRHAGGLRVDHIIGLFRLWWIPAGKLATHGTYVRYDHDAAIGILALEAERAGAVVVGEDLGTVEPWVRDYLHQRGILGTSVLWFEYDADRAPLVPKRWREYCLASVTTHDLPPTAGYLAGAHVRLRHELGLTAGSLAEALAADRKEQQAWLDVARDRGLLPAQDPAAGDPPSGDPAADDPAADVAETVAALHRLLTEAPSRLRCLALTDAVGDRRTQNQPGTKDEYPNWRVALTGPDGAVVSLEDVLHSRRAAELADIMRGPARA